MTYLYSMTIIYKIIEYSTLTIFCDINMVVKLSKFIYYEISISTCLYNEKYYTG